MSTEKRMSKPKPVKAWAVVENGVIRGEFSPAIFWTKEIADRYPSRKSERVIPVLITPLEEKKP